MTAPTTDATTLARELLTLTKRAQEVGTADGMDARAMLRNRPALVSHVASLCESVLTLTATVSRLTAALAGQTADAERLDWWFSHGMNDSVCDGSVDLWWADGEAEQERVTHGTSVRDALDKAMRGIYEPDDTPTAQPAERTHAE